jgi:heme-degrading monooxygenase HmoA
MAIAYLITYEASDPDTIVQQLKAYKERELDRSPPKGFLDARILEGTDGKTVTFLTEWVSEEELEDTRDSAPWEACMDLNETFSDSNKALTFKMIS